MLTFLLMLLLHHYCLLWNSRSARAGALAVIERYRTNGSKGSMIARNDIVLVININIGVVLQFRLLVRVVFIRATIVRFLVFLCRGWSHDAFFHAHNAVGSTAASGWRPIVVIISFGFCNCSLHVMCAITMPRVRRRRAL
jgi:hypothetical protein